MDINAILEPFMEQCPRIAELDDAAQHRLALMVGSVDETVGINHLVDCLADKSSLGGDGTIRCYVGFEPSGKAHIGWKVLSLQLRRMLEADANVLIFERIKDELRRGNTLIRSIDTGFSEAFSSIVDGHLTTLISCAALFFLGTGLVKGFAATLGIGVLLSLFTALTCTRTLLRFLMGYSGLRSPNNFLPNSQLPTPSA